MTRTVVVAVGVVVTSLAVQLPSAQTPALNTSEAPAPSQSAADLARALDQVRQAFDRGDYAAAERALNGASAILSRVQAAALRTAGAGGVSPSVSVSGTRAANAVQPVRVGGQVGMPMLLQKVTPVYPSDAKAAGTQGTVFIEAVIDTVGNVADARVIRSVSPEIDASALDAVTQWRYSPTTLAGQPVPVMLTVTINFSLQ